MIDSAKSFVFTPEACQAFVTPEGGNGFAATLEVGNGLVCSLDSGSVLLEPPMNSVCTWDGGWRSGNEGEQLGVGDVRPLDEVGVPVLEVVEGVVDDLVGGLLSLFEHLLEF